MNYLTMILAAAGGFDGMTISVAAIAALGTAVAVAVKAFKAGEAKGKQTVAVDPVPLPVEVVADLATKDELRDVEGRLTGEIRKLENHQNGERAVARNANSNIHQRLDKMAEKSDLLRIHERIDAQSLATAAATASLNEVKSSVSKLLDLAIQRKPASRA